MGGYNPGYYPLTKYSEPLRRAFRVSFPNRPSTGAWQGTSMAPAGGAAPPNVEPVIKGGHANSSSARTWHLRRSRQPRNSSETKVYDFWDKPPYGC